MEWLQTVDDEMIIRVKSRDLFTIREMASTAIRVQSINSDTCFKFDHMQRLTITFHEPTTCTQIADMIQKFQECQLGTDCQLTVSFSLEIEPDQQEKSLREILRPLRQFDNITSLLINPTERAADEYYRFESIGPRAFRHFGNLTELSLNCVEIVRIDANAFAGLDKLEHLDLSDCRLERVEVDTFGSLRNLESLTLSLNNLNHLEAGVFRRLVKLKHLNLDQNPLEQSMSEDLFCGLENLETLCLIRTGLAERYVRTAPIFTKHLKGLERLYLNTNWEEAFKI
jgi:hypothetical protein